MGDPVNERKFNAGEPLAYFITWTCYGTWLSGDERGSWKRGEWQSPNSVFREMAAAEEKETPFYLQLDDRNIVSQTISKHCEIRNWTLWTESIRTNHVHLVVTAPGYQPEVVSEQFKAWCTRKLKPTHSDRKRFWTEGASRRWINHEEDLDAVIQYVNEAQDRKQRDD
ncbi:transposase [Planctomicrobium sp.]|jgi:REP element-mobilizing transposase RayT|nr:transposase [Planctomicrobium sp.]